MFLELASLPVPPISSPEMLAAKRLKPSLHEIGVPLCYAVRKLCSIFLVVMGGLSRSGTARRWGWTRLGCCVVAAPKAQAAVARAERAGTVYLWYPIVPYGMYLGMPKWK